MEDEVKMIDLVSWPTIITFGWIYILGIASCTPDSRSAPIEPPAHCRPFCN